MDTIYTLFKSNVQKTPDKKAIIYQELSLSYEALDKQACKLASHLSALGLTKGQRVAVFLPNSVEFVVSLLAIAKLGLTAVPLPVTLKGMALSTALKKTPVASVIAWPTVGKALVNAGLVEMSMLITCGNKLATEVTWSEVQNSEPNHLAEREVDIYAPFILTMTSGSTGQPKPIILSQACKINRAKLATIDYYGLSNQDVILVATPLYHSLAQRGVLMPLLLGATTVILPKFSLEQWLQAIEQHRVSFLFAVSAQLESLVKYGTHEYDISSLRCLVSSSAVLEEQTKKRLLDILPCRFHECYGASEVGVVTDLAVSDTQEKSGSVGKPLPFVDLIITDNNGCAVKEGEVGEICCKTATVFGGYLKMPEQTRDAFYLGEYFKTGDLGYLDHDGYLYYVGRNKEVISSGGINVFPQDIESVVKMVEGVVDCVAFGLEDSKLGEVVKVVVEAHCECDLSKEIRKICLQQLTDYQQPRYLQQVATLPRNQMGKVLRSDVKKLYS